MLYSPTYRFSAQILRILLISRIKIKISEDLSFALSLPNYSSYPQYQYYFWIWPLASIFLNYFFPNISNVLYLHSIHLLKLTTTFSALGKIWGKEILHGWVFCKVRGMSKKRVASTKCTRNKYKKLRWFPISSSTRTLYLNLLPYHADTYLIITYKNIPKLNISVFKCIHYSVQFTSWFPVLTENNQEEYILKSR